MTELFCAVIAAWLNVFHSRLVGFRMNMFVDFIRHYRTVHLYSSTNGIPISCANCDCESRDCLDNAYPWTMPVLFDCLQMKRKVKKALELKKAAEVRALETHEK